MPHKINNAQELQKLRDRLRAEMDIRQCGKNRELSKISTAEGNSRIHVLVCAGAGCVASGSLEVSAALRKCVGERALNEQVAVVETGCLGPCAIGPVVVIYPDGIFYENVAPADAEDIVQEHLIGGQIVERLAHKLAPTEKIVAQMDKIDFFSGQQRIVLRNCGLVDPLKIEEYIARDGYEALAKVLTSMSREAVIDVVARSGLRGRGGGGFPTGKKWELARVQPGDTKYVICNGDEGDPGAFMDRSVMEGDPHSVIEAMTIAAYTIGSSQGYIYVRAEYPLAIKRLTAAIQQAKAYGLLGNNILGTQMSFDLEIRMGSGAFVCGEETALMTSIEGNRGEPKPRPPFPAQQGLWGKPSLLNNVETFANIPAIILKGAEWFASFGTEKSKGTKVFALAGAVNNTGLVEIPVGTPLGGIIYDIGGGIPNGKKFKAAQIGGPSGGCVPKEFLNIPVDYESLTQVGAIMGSGGLIVMDEDTCMVDMARFFLDFIQDESCGKCPPCRIGTKRMLEIIDRICTGKGKEGDIEKLIDLGNKIKDTALCGLGQTAPNPVLSTIRHFREEYEIHIREKRCPAGVCPSLVRSPCQNACPAGVDIPGFISYIGEKRYAEALKLHRERNPFASVCARVCFHTCEDKCRRSTLDEPVSIRALKRFMTEQEVTIQVPDIQENEQNANRKIAIVGGGPAGLSCAYFLARLGYKPKVFEAEVRPGGMLVQTIPAYRLPREELAREVRMIERMGVDIETNMRLGKDFTLKSLRDEGYDAVFLAIGAPYGSKLGIPGEDAQGVSDAIQFLREYNIRGSAWVGKNVVVIGGGNAAIDASRTAIRLGAKSVTIIYRRTRVEMPAYVEEIEEAEKEGVEIRTQVSPLEIITEDGKVSGIRCGRMSLGEFDRTGRRSPKASGEGDFIIPADQVIPAIGQYLEPKEVFDGMDIKMTKSRFVDIDPISGKTSVDWIFSGGDSALGPSSVADAVGSGERAAVAINQMLSGQLNAFWRAEAEKDTYFDPDADPAAYPRAKIRLTPVAKRRTSFAEVEMPWNESVAVKEAKRCLRCDYRENCDDKRSQ